MSADGTSRTTKRSQTWLVVLLVFSITSMIEGLGVCQIIAFMPLAL